MENSFFAPQSPAPRERHSRDHHDTRGRRYQGSHHPAPWVTIILRHGKRDKFDMKGGMTFLINLRNVISFGVLVRMDKMDIPPLVNNGV